MSKQTPPPLRTTDAALKDALKALARIATGEESNARAVAEQAVLELSRCRLVGVDDVLGPLKPKHQQPYLSLADRKIQQQLAQKKHKSV